MSLLEKVTVHFQESYLPWYSLVVALFWHAIYVFVGDKVLLACIPEKGRLKVEDKKERDPERKLVFQVNGVAFLHASFVVPLAMILLVACRSNEMPNTCDGGMYLFHGILGVTMLGYFLWDIALCVVHYKTFQSAFLLHAIFSYIALYVNMAAQRSRLECWGTFFQISEISTPFMHVRYALIQGELNYTTYFKVMNWIFIILFSFYRLVLVEIFGFYPFFKALWLGNLPMSKSRMASVIFTIIGWSALNYGWGLTLLRSQLRQLGRKEKKRE